MAASTGAGALNRRVRIQTQTVDGGRDEWGVPLPPIVTWEHAWCNIRAPSGVGAIRDGVSGEVPLSTTRYSLKFRRNIADRMRPGQVVYVPEGSAGLHLRVEGIVHDLASRKYCYVLCTHDGTKAGR